MYSILCAEKKRVYINNNIKMPTLFPYFYYIKYMTALFMTKDNNVVVFFCIFNVNGRIIISVWVFGYLAYKKICSFLVL